MYINPYKAFTGCFVPNWLLRSDIVSLGAKLVYARLCQYAGERGIAFPKLETLATECAISQRTLARYMDELKDSHLVHVERVGLQCANRYRFKHHPIMDMVADQDLPMVATPDLPTLADQDLPMVADHIERESNERESTSLYYIGMAEAKPPPVADKAMELAGEMIDYLNKICDRSYTVTGGGAKALRARCKTAKTDVALMAMRVACKCIVDYKFAEWGADPNMRQYLRPETLFSNEHWESYLQAAMDWDSRGRPAIRKHMNGKMPVETMTQRAARIVAEIEAEGGL